jgi:hypothetical protein
LAPDGRWLTCVGAGGHDGINVAGHRACDQTRGQAAVECKIELIFIPVTDVDKAIEFYVDKVGFTLDMQAQVSENLRFVQVTPPTSACFHRLR